MSARRILAETMLSAATIYLAAFALLVVASW